MFYDKRGAKFGIIRAWCKFLFKIFKKKGFCVQINSYSRKYLLIWISL